MATLKVSRGQYVVTSAELVETLGAAVFTSAITFNNDVTLGDSLLDDLTVNATAVFNNSLTVLGNVTLSGDNVTIGNSSTDILQVFSTTTFENDVTIGSSSADDLIVIADADFRNDVILGSSSADVITVKGSFAVNNGIQITAGEINFTGTAVFNWNLGTSAGAGALRGYLNIQVGGTNRRIPYYAV